MTILILEDDADLRRLHAEVLADEGFEILQADSLAQAVALSDGREGSIDLLLADVGAGGLQAAEAIRAARPGLRVVLTSGSHDEPEHALGFEVRFLFKPSNFALLLRTINEALE